MSTTVQIKAPNILNAIFRINGTAPLVQAKFSAKAKAQIMATQEAGSVARGKKVRQAKNFDETMNACIHYSKDGWIGFPASAIRSGMIDACRLVGFKMTMAKMSAFVVADGFDVDDGTPLVKLIAGDPRRVDLHVRNQTGVVDLRSRPMWDEWAADVHVRYDADQFCLEDVTNLLSRVGEQVGIGEGRPFSKNSAGMGWGTFKIAEQAAA